MKIPVQCDMAWSGRMACRYLCTKMYTVTCQDLGPLCTWTVTLLRDSELAQETNANSPCPSTVATDLMRLPPGPLVFHMRSGLIWEGIVRSTNKTTPGSATGMLNSVAGLALHRVSSSSIHLAAYQDSHQRSPISVAAVSVATATDS